MYVDIKPIVCLHLERGLYTRLREWCLRGVGRNGLFHVAADFRKTGFHIVVFLGVVITGNPPSDMVTSHGKLRMFFFNDEVNKFLLYGELISQANALVVYSETDVHQSLGLRLRHFHQQFVIMIADISCLTPNGLPGLVEGAGR